MVRRFVLMLAAAAMGASSVAPAQVLPESATEKVVKAVAQTMNEPLVTTPLSNDPLAPAEVAGGEEAAAVPAIVDEEEAVTVTPGASLSETVAQLRRSDAGSRELECLAVGVYFESKSEPLAGQLAVGQVIANRAESGRFPSSYCGVLTQRGQFSFVRGGRWPAVKKASMQWKNAVAIARIVDGDLKQSHVGKAMFFHAKRVSPGWRLTRVASVGNHVFYR